MSNCSYPTMWCGNNDGISSRVTRKTLIKFASNKKFNQCSTFPFLSSDWDWDWAWAWAWDWGLGIGMGMGMEMGNFEWEMGMGKWE